MLKVQFSAPAQTVRTSLWLRSTQRILNNLSLDCSSSPAVQRSTLDFSVPTVPQHVATLPENPLRQSAPGMFAILTLLCRERTLIPNMSMKHLVLSPGQSVTSHLPVLQVPLSGRGKAVTQAFSLTADRIVNNSYSRLRGHTTALPSSHVSHKPQVWLVDLLNVPAAHHFIWKTVEIVSVQSSPHCTVHPFVSSWQTSKLLNLFSSCLIGVATIAYSDYFLSLNCNGGICNSLSYIQVSSISPPPHSQWALIVSSLLHCPACAADSTLHASLPDQMAVVSWDYVGVFCLMSAPQYSYTVTFWYTLKGWLLLSGTFCASKCILGFFFFSISVKNHIGVLMWMALNPDSLCKDMLSTHLCLVNYMLLLDELTTKSWCRVFWVLIR